MNVSTLNPEPDEEEDRGSMEEDDPELWFETMEGNITTNRKGFHQTATPLVDGQRFI